MKPREIILLVLTVIIIGGSFYFLREDPEATTEGAAAVVSGDLETVRKKFSDNLEFLQNGHKIDADYQKLSDSLEDSPGLDPGMAAQNQLYKVLTEKLNVQTPTVNNSQPVPIKNVDEYYFVNINFNVNGSESEMKKLLRDIERLGFLIQSFNLEQENHGQNDYMKLDVTVSKLVKHTKESRERLNPKKAAWSRGG